MAKIKGGDLFIVDNSVEGWTGLRYLEEWSEFANSFDIATGYFEIGSRLLVQAGFSGRVRERIERGRTAGGDGARDLSEEGLQTGRTRRAVGLFGAPRWRGTGHGRLRRWLRFRRRLRIGPGRGLGKGLLARLAAPVDRDAGSRWRRRIFRTPSGASAGSILLPLRAGFLAGALRPVLLVLVGRRNDRPERRADR